MAADSYCMAMFGALTKANTGCLWCRQTGSTNAAGLTDKPVSDRWLQHAIEAPGYVLGLSTGQAAGTAQFLAKRGQRG
jgi:hypothetical protein